LLIILIDGKVEVLFLGNELHALRMRTPF